MTWFIIGMMALSAVGTAAAIGFCLEWDYRAELKRDQERERFEEWKQLERRINHVEERLNDTFKKATTRKPLP